MMSVQAKYEVPVAASQCSPFGQRADAELARKKSSCQFWMLDESHNSQAERSISADLQVLRNIAVGHTRP